MKNFSLFGLLAVTGVATPANAYEFRARFVEQTGDGPDEITVLDDNTIDASDFAARRIRVQFGVFDDASSAAPHGGFLGWNAGTITVNGDSGNSAESRTPGRIAPWNFAPRGNGTPTADPFDALTGVDNTLGHQVLIWFFGAPRPNPLIRGLNSYVSTYEFTIDPTDGSAFNYSIDVGGNVLAALGWNILQENPPVSEEEPGTVLYTPAPGPATGFSGTLNVIVPAPGAGSLLGLGGLAALRRRRWTATR